MKQGDAFKCVAIIRRYGLTPKQLEAALELNRVLSLDRTAERASAIAERILVSPFEVFRLAMNRGLEMLDADRGASSNG